MAGLSLTQIINRLNEEFTGDTRKLVFWYDDNGEFVEDMQNVTLDNAKVYFLHPDNQFATKLFLERTDTTTNYLIYAPFPKPDVQDNHLEDTMLYSKRFFADRASLLSVDLGIDEKYKPIIEKYIKFFASKERTQRFYDLEIENFNEENIITGLLSAICRTRTCSFEEVVRVMLTDSSLENNKFLIDIEKYGLLSDFWKLCEQHFGYADVKPTLEKLVVTMFVTYTAKYIPSELPKPWKVFSSYKAGNIIAFMDNLMNSILYRSRYDELSSHVATGLNTQTVFSNYPPEDLLNCDTFAVFDQLLMKWVVERLVAEDTGAKLNDLTIPQICEKRRKMHFGEKVGSQYQMLSSAYQIIQAGNYHCPDSFEGLLRQYQEEDYRLDYEYRRFYFAYDQIEDTAAFEPLRDLVENIYTNEYLEVLLPKWNSTIQEPDAFTQLPLQRDFYGRNVKNAKERTVVIISDALRYEVGKELFRRMQDDPKCSARLEVQLSVLPSYTRLGMAALLPHTELTMTDDFKVLVDGLPCEDLSEREAILQKYNADAVCVQFDSIKSLKIAELRSVFTGKQVVYVYHNQIDARGDKPNTEDEVFVACSEAISEIIDLIRRVATSANTYRFIVTADHGFIYKRDKVTESDKIDGIKNKTAFLNRRFVVTSEPISDDGVASMSMGMILRNADTKWVSFPISDNVFKAGGGQNYVHGGSSPQEMLVPVLDIKMERGHMDTRNASIALVSMVRKITNKITILDFIQSEPVSDVVKPATYRLFFLSEDNERISNENSYIADSRDQDAQKRIFRMKFQFKDKKYDKDKQYFFVVYDDTTGLEVFRHPVIMDLAFTDDYGF
ncbi:BREX-1 system phosphatase PglZ type A [Butyricicoccus pullicaecorum]|uniref:TIGR02687 family protein n=1 Tax=Butyricicoccus pullicaecorum TaxID=501571 RepID=A0A1Y4LWQ6_9FIRM|nr:BREX-1 system phosphatase PglZ type A [Butyricicoccus pullicaecorum]OUP58762.1 TIGR02687 family protein [Butyricicoccus pullicaecorum]